MANYFTDNHDIQFLLNHHDLPRLAEIMEDGFVYAGQFEAAPRNGAEASEKYRRILTELGRIAAEEIAPTAKETDEKGSRLGPDGAVTYAPGLDMALRRISETGLMGCTLPYRYGGLNCPNLILTATNDIISRADASLMNLYGLQGIGETINAFADEKTREEYLPDMAAGRKTGAMVLTEPNSGSDLQSVKVSARQDENGQWRINGVKRFITNGGGDVLLVMARSEPDITDGRGLSLFLVEKGPRVQVRRMEHKLGIRGSPTCELLFDDAPGRLIGERQQGLIKYVMALMFGARMGIAAQSCGIGEAAFRVARQYAHERRQFGTEIESFPAVRDLLVESSLDLHAARALTYFSSSRVDLQYGAERAAERAPDDDARKQAKADARKYKKENGLLTPLSKYYASEMCMRVAMNSISVMGGNGYMHDYPLERLLRDSRITTIYEGTTQMQIVAAVGAVTTGVAESILLELLDRDWPADIAPMVEELRSGLESLSAASAFAKDDPDPDYRRLCARALTDMAIILLVGALFCNHAAADAARKVLARHWLDSRMPDLRRHRERICSGTRLTLREFEALAGPAAEVEAKVLSTPAMA
ncbi:MAG: acyl-CoA dehydrogenase family protein [Phycisphaerales bacterium]|nr:acyl-CoA dehydrogenase family protein [Phycisphaerales bacterium]